MWAGRRCCDCRPLKRENEELKQKLDELNQKYSEQVELLEGKMIQQSYSILESMSPDAQNLGDRLTEKNQPLGDLGDKNEKQEYLATSNTPVKVLCLPKTNDLIPKG